MITEILTYVSSYLRKTGTKEARAFGHLYEAIALVHREKRVADYWLPHRTSCKNFITRHSPAPRASQSSVLVLGAGPLHEIPVEFLASRFSRVDLVDVVHLDETKKKWSHLKNLRFIEADVTELEKEILLTKKPVEKIPEAFLNDGYDLVISANLMSQLAYHLRNFLSKKRFGLGTEELDEFSYSVTKNHFLYLQKFTCPAILITDVEIQLLDKNGVHRQTDYPFFNFSLPAPQETWWWNVAPIPEYSKDVAVKMKVAGFVLNV